MKHYDWSELDYIAGAAHVEGMSYGRFVSMGMPNLQRFKNRVAAGEFDNKPVRARKQKAVVPPVETAKPAEPEKKTKPVPRPEHIIPEGKCKDCGAVLPAENRAGPRRKLCEMCKQEHARAKARRTAAKHRERVKAQRLLLEAIN